MLLSNDKISHLAHLVLTGLKKDQHVNFLMEGEKVLREVKRTIIQDLQIEEEIDETVRAKLASYSRPISEGSPEWEVLYQKFFREEQNKRKQ